MTSHTPAWKWIVALALTGLGASAAIPLYRYADADDAPGGMVIAWLVFFVAVALATWVVRPRQ